MLFPKDFITLFINICLVLIYYLLFNIYKTVRKQPISAFQIFKSPHKATKSYHFVVKLQ